MNVAKTLTRTSRGNNTIWIGLFFKVYILKENALFRNSFLNFYIENKKKTFKFLLKYKKLKTGARKYKTKTKNCLHVDTK